MPKGERSYIRAVQENRRANTILAARQTQGDVRMPGNAPVTQYQGAKKKVASTGKTGTLLESFVDGYYNKTITGRSLKKAKGVIDYLASPVEPKARKQDRLDLNPRLRKRDKEK